VVSELVLLRLHLLFEVRLFLGPLSDHVLLPPPELVVEVLPLVLQLDLLVQLLRVGPLPLVVDVCLRLYLPLVLLSLVLDDGAPLVDVALF